MSQNERVMKGDASEFANQMKKLVNNKEHSDIKFFIGPNRKNIYAHRCLLASRCAVFKAMFADQSQNQKAASPEKDVPFVLSDMSPEVFLTMMEYIYTNTASLNQKTAIDVLATSLEYGLDDLRRICVDYLIDHLSVTNACESMQAAVTYGQEYLRKQTLKYIESHTQSVFKSKAFQEMSGDALIVILQSSKLELDEIEILHAVKDWASVNSVIAAKSISACARNVIIHVRLPLLSPDELAKVEKDNEKDNCIPVESLAHAWRVHALKKGEKGNLLTTKRRGTVQRDSHQYLELSHES